VIPEIFVTVGPLLLTTYKEKQRQL